MINELRERMVAVYHATKASTKNPGTPNYEWSNVLAGIYIYSLMNEFPEDIYPTTEFPRTFPEEELIEWQESALELTDFATDYRTIKMLSGMHPNFDKVMSKMKCDPKVQRVFTKLANDTKHYKELHKKRIC